MIRGGDFYAIWINDQNRWSTDENDAIKLIDSMLDQYYKENKEQLEEKAAVYNEDYSSQSLPFPLLGGQKRKDCSVSYGS